MESGYGGDYAPRPGLHQSESIRSNGRFDFTASERALTNFFWINTSFKLKYLRRNITMVVATTLPWFRDETNTSLSETIRIGAFAESRKATVQPEMVMPEVPFSRLLKKAQAAQPVQKELPVEPVLPNKLDTENGNTKPAQQPNDDFIILDLKTPFAGCNSNSELGVFYRECQSAPPLQGTESSLLTDQLGDLTKQLEAFETSFRQYDSVITKVCSQDNNN